MSSVNGSISKSNVATLETEDRKMTGHLPPPPPPPPSFYNGQDYRAVRGLDNLGRGRGGVAEGDLEDLEFLMQEEFSEYDVEEAEPESFIPAVNVEQEEVSTASADSVETAPKAAVETPTAPTAEEKQEFLSEIREAKNGFKEIVESNEDLTPEQKQQFITRFNEQADALGNATDLEKAREELSNLPVVLTEEVQAAVTTTREETKKRREALYQEMVGFTQAPRFRETQGHWWHKGIELGEKFLSALQTDDWSGFKSHLSTLEGNQRWVCVMRVVTAIYRSAGKDEEKAIQMLNNFVPKDVVQAMVDSVMSEPQNMDWGNGDRNECGPEGLVEWNIPGTADFLRRSLEARRQEDPYAPMTGSSSAS